MCCSAALLKFEGRPQDESSTHLRNKTSFSSLIMKLKPAVLLHVFQRLNPFCQEQQKILPCTLDCQKSVLSFPQGRRDFSGCDQFYSEYMKLYLNVWFPQGTMFKDIANIFLSEFSPCIIFSVIEKQLMSEWLSETFIINAVGFLILPGWHKPGIVYLCQ